jgi:hypothetical protein
MLLQVRTWSADVAHIPRRPLRFDGPSLEGIIFSLKSNNPDNPDAPNHTLTITTQTFVSVNFAFIQGTWQGDGPTAKDFTGSLTDGTVSMTCSWANGMGGTNTLIAGIIPGSQIVANLWELSGNVIVTNSSGEIVPAGPGIVTGAGHPAEVSLP